MNKIQVSKVKNIDNALVIKKVGDDNSFFLTSPDSFIISTQNLSALLCFIIKNGFLPHEVLEGILEDYHSNNW